MPKFYLLYVKRVSQKSFGLTAQNFAICSYVLFRSWTGNLKLFSAEQLVVHEKRTPWKFVFFFKRNWSFAKFSCSCFTKLVRVGRVSGNVRLNFATKIVITEKKFEHKRVSLRQFLALWYEKKILEKNWYPVWYIPKICEIQIAKVVAK